MINMQKGRIIKIISNQYTIQNEKEEIIAKPRGKMRQHEAPADASDRITASFV